MSKRAPPPPTKPPHLTSPATTPSNPPHTSPHPSPKRGLGWPWDYPGSHFTLYTTDSSSPSPISWLFNWELWVPPGLPPSMEWVPTIRTAAQIPDLVPFLTDITSNQNIKISHLLGFNEPEIPSQANLSVDEAVRLWRQHVLPAKSRFGVRLGSPGMSSDMSLSTPWLDAFFAQLGEDHGVDFLVLHWYGTSFAAMRRFLQDMQERYRLPVWLNEFACTDMGGAGVGEEGVRGFMREAVRWLEGCAWVERYAWFGNGQGGTVGEWVGKENGFCEGVGEGEKLTGVGRLYLQL
ncbi:glycoside hydrolase family 128 protein [Plenodomus tracheiphilus IPT5]|uniref:Glycoside hydrolase family 128 protein n=1 Tax=Plenodomus tracheiphilus IPT5 TaxID=1408161 RepID=A0A6A7AYA4_9PLEO|nr:glycoside hydrolase family 128 protein [Plenodomus tracheiphilus IPT5]